MTPASAPRRSAAEQARLESALTELIEHHISFNAVLGIKVLSLTPGDVRCGLTMKPELVGHSAYGRLHGGVTSSVLDVVGALALMVEASARHPGDSAAQVMARFNKMGTIDLRVDFLRQGIGREFLATAEVTRLGGRVGSTLMRLTNESGEVISTGAASYIVS